MFVYITIVGTWIANIFERNWPNHDDVAGLNQQLSHDSIRLIQFNHTWKQFNCKSKNQTCLYQVKHQVSLRLVQPAGPIWVLWPWFVSPHCSLCAATCLKHLNNLINILSWNSFQYIPKQSITIFKRFKRLYSNGILIIRFWNITPITNHGFLPNK